MISIVRGDVNRSQGMTRKAKKKKEGNEETVTQKVKPQSISSQGSALRAKGPSEKGQCIEKVWRTFDPWSHCQQPEIEE